MSAKGFGFRPLPFLGGGHRQTLAGVFFPGRLPPDRAAIHHIPTNDVDRLALHDDGPIGLPSVDGERLGRAYPVALLLHGLSGTSLSPYMVRIASKLNSAGIRTFRMDLRGCGAGMTIARETYHAGRSDDAACALAAVARLCPGSPVTLIGFSLSGNIVLKLAAEVADQPPENLDSVIAVCPPVDLADCVRSLARPVNRIYDRYFTRSLVAQVAERRRVRPDVPDIDLRGITRLVEFDDRFTGPVNGFGSAANYYVASSAMSLLPKIRIPTLILAAADDPLAPAETFNQAALSASTTLVMPAGGGHLGFIGQREPGRDRRWMDWRIVDFVARRYS